MPSIFLLFFRCLQLTCKKFYYLGTVFCWFVTGCVFITRLKDFTISSGGDKHSTVRTLSSLTLKAPVTSRLQQTTFINIFLCFSEKIRLDVSSESSDSSEDKSKKLKCRLLQFLFGAFRVKVENYFGSVSW